LPHASSPAKLRGALYHTTVPSYRLVHTATGVSIPGYQAAFASGDLVEEANQRMARHGCDLRFQETTLDGLNFSPLSAKIATPQQIPA
jgi:hypothetical protein